MADEKIREAWKKSEKILASGNADESLKILREIDASGEHATTLRIAGEATWAIANHESSKSEYRKAASLLRDAVKKDPRDKKANATYNSLLNEMQDKGIKETTIPRLINDGTPTIAGIITLVGVILISLVALKLASTTSSELPTEATLELSWTDTSGEIQTGTVVVELYPDEAPMHVENFGLLAEDGKYDGTVFHRIISDFMMQGGDFTSGDGTGGHAGKFFGYCNGLQANSSDDCSIDSYTVPDEADNGRSHTPYSLSMAKSNNPHTGGSQFFIVDPDTEAADGSPGTPHLDGVHTVFGEVTSGFEHIDAITALCDNQNCPNDKTPQDVVLESVTTNFFQRQGEIVSFRDSYNHSFPYIDDLDNDNMNSWNILGMPSYSLIQPNGIIAWDTNNPMRYWNHSTKSPSVASIMECGLFFCDLEHMIYKLVDYNVSINGSLDSDGDGVIDEEDEFPNDANETHDDDGDGVGNNTDAFPQDANETHDDDGDGVGNNTDAFPQDASETMDTDGDGVGDNEDVEPDNPDIRYSDDIKVEISDTSSYIIAGAIVFLALVILFVRRKQPPMTDVHSQFAYEESLFKDN